MHTRTKFLLPLLALALPACVSTSQYDAALQSASDTRAELRSVVARDRATLADLQAKLDLAAAEEQKLQDKLDWAGLNEDALAYEKERLSTALADSRMRFEEIRRAQAASEARARLFHDLAVKLKKMVDSGDLRIALREGRMVLQLSSDVLFDSGQVDIKPRGRAALKELAAVMKSLGNRRFEVAGHTDDVPIDTQQFPSNWELSTARGVVVVHFLIAQGVPATSLAAAGYGEFDPVAPNIIPRGRTLNRRIEIALQPNVDELVAVPDVK